MNEQPIIRSASTEILPAVILSGVIGAVLCADGQNFLTRPVETLALSFDGIAGDFHGGATRKSGGREPWYPRGTEIRNERQVSILAPDKLALIAERLGLDEVRPEWMGGNLLLEGIPHRSMLPPQS